MTAIPRPARLSALIIAAAAASLSLCLAPGPLRAQAPTLDSLAIVPPAPTIFDDIGVFVGGTVNTSGSPMFRLEWRRIHQDIRLDILIDELPVGAPPDIQPYNRSALLGQLPAGDYELTAQIWWLFRGGPDSPFPHPWTFPDVFGGPPGQGPLPGTQQLLFRVVPEPAGLALVGCAVMAGAHFRKRPRRQGNSLRRAPRSRR